MQELASDVYVETGFRHVNVGAILTQEGWVLIDTPPHPEDALRWRDRLAGVANKPVLAIVNTDGHRDHILGNCWFGAHVIVAHQETVNQLNNLPSSFLDNMIDDLTDSVPLHSGFSDIRMCVPTVGFTQRMQLCYGTRRIPLVTMPGPAVGSIWVHLHDEKIVFTGDSVVVDQHPHILSSCTKVWLENLTALRRPRFVADQIVPGRGPVTDKSATESISEYLRLARRRVQSLYRAGRPRADTSTLVPELLDVFEHSPRQQEALQRRIKAGLDRIYDEFKAGERSNGDFGVS